MQRVVLVLFLAAACSYQQAGPGPEASFSLAVTPASLALPPGATGTDLASGAVETALGKPGVHGLKAGPLAARLNQPAGLAVFRLWPPGDLRPAGERALAGPLRALTRNRARCQR